MGEYVKKLLKISGPALAPSAGSVPGVSADLAALLAERNGFYAFESALHVFALTATPLQYSLAQWNAPSLWIDSYGDLAKGYLFFAEDVFGGQFAIRDGNIYQFDPETAAVELVGGSIEEWAKALLADYDFLTGYPAAHEWQTKHGALPPGKRLGPKIPFVGGGAFDIANLYVADPLQLMRFRGMIAQKIKDLPDGARISFKVTPP